MALRVLIKLKRETINALHDPTTGINELYKDKDKPWFEKSYVAEAHARSGWVNERMREGISGYAVWDDEHGLVQTFETLESADFAARNAKMTLAVQFNVPDEPSPEDVADNPAPAAQKGKTRAAELGAAAS
jgi:hypothetical protein